MMPTVAQLLQEHGTLSIACTDRLYINGYLPGLQTSGQLVYFLHNHLGNRIASPALFGPMRERFVAEIEGFSKREHAPLVHFSRGERKDSVANQLRARFTAPEGVVFIGVAQERASSFRGKKVATATGCVSFDFSRQPVFVNHYYFYLQDLLWGPAFLKVGSYLPYPVKICLNGHEWAKQQLRLLGVGFEPLDNGFLSCEDPALLQRICDGLGPEDIQGFFDRWSSRLPWPLTPENRAAGYEHKLSIWQAEFSLTHIFERPVQGRQFFEQVIRDNLDLGRPDRVQLIFPRRITRATPDPERGWKTRVITQGVAPAIHASYKSSDIKQYFKEGRALRTETTINDPGDFGINKGIENFPALSDLGQNVNQRLLDSERLSPAAVLDLKTRDAIEQPTWHDGQRAAALRLGDLRVSALLAALCMFLHLARGFRNRDLRVHVAALLGLQPELFSAGRMTYDLRRLRLKGLIERVPKTHRYQLTPLGLRVALFYTRLEDRVLRPGFAAAVNPEDPIPRPLSQALEAVDHEVRRMCHDAGLQLAA